MEAPAGPPGLGPNFAPRVAHSAGRAAAAPPSACTQDVIAKAKDLHPKLLGGAFFFFALGASGGMLSLIMQVRRRGGAATGAGGVSARALRCACRRARARAGSLGPPLQRTCESCRLRPLQVSEEQAAPSSRNLSLTRARAQGKPILESPHATTGFIGLGLLGLQALLPGEAPRARGECHSSPRAQRGGQDWASTRPNMGVLCCMHALTAMAAPACLPRAAFFQEDPSTRSIVRPRTPSRRAARSGPAPQDMQFWRGA